MLGVSIAEHADSLPFVHCRREHRLPQIADDGSHVTLHYYPHFILLRESAQGVSELVLEDSEGADMLALCDMRRVRRHLE